MKRIVIFLYLIPGLLFAMQRDGYHTTYLTFPIPQKVKILTVESLVQKQVSPIVKRLGKQYFTKQKFHMPILSLGKKVTRSNALSIHEAILATIKGTKSINNLYLGMPHLLGSEVVLPVFQSSEQLIRFVTTIRSSLKKFETTRVYTFYPHVILGDIPGITKSRDRNAINYVLKKIKNGNFNNIFSLGMINLYWDGKLWIQYYLPTQTFYQFNLGSGAVENKGNF